MNTCAYLVLLLLLGTVQFMIDVLSPGDYHARCYNDDPVSFLGQNWVHHVLFVFVATGWLCDDPRVLVIHLVTIWIVLLNWEANYGMCSLTMRINDLCGRPEGADFRDVTHFLGVKNEVTLLTVIVILGMTISAYKFFCSVFLTKYQNE
jgi:hypothetical protein